LCITFLHSSNNISQQYEFCFFLSMDHKLLCTKCAQWHLRCKAFKSHHVIDLSSVGSRIPPSSKINCEIHTKYRLIKIY
jgi:hypothetical protein